MITSEYPKGVPVQVSEHFRSTDFDCKCTRKVCDKTVIALPLIEAIEALWLLVGPLQVEDGFRCDLRNLDPIVCGARDSKHMLGIAADLKSLKGLNGNLLARKAEEIFILDAGAIGMGMGKIHVDLRPERTRWCHPVRC